MGGAITACLRWGCRGRAVAFGSVPIDPRTPVLAGAGQVVQRVTDPLAADEPAALMAEALRRAAADTGATSDLLGRADSIRTLGTLSWRYPDPGRAVAALLGIDPRQSLTTATGGNGPQYLVNVTAAAIQRAELDVALIAGGEAMYSRLLARKHGVRLPWTPLPEGAGTAEVIGDERQGTNDVEGRMGLLGPPVVYPLFENALRHASGESLEAHRRRVTSLWSRFSEVAAQNPYAWSRQSRSADELASPTPDNRMIAFPYPKLLNANLQTDQAAALVLCSLEAARAAGVPDEHLVFPLAGADAHDHWWISSRRDFHSSPAIAAAGRAALGLAEVGIDDVTEVDLYSCFPSAVQIGGRALGLPVDDPDRPLTVTGGLTFAGGPGNNYSTHAIATMAGRLRSGPGEIGLVTALGWYITKHSVGVYSTRPPAHGFRAVDAQADVDATPSREYVDSEELEGPATLETYTVTYERDGPPALAIAACLLDDGTRTWASTTDGSVLSALITEEGCGRPVVLADRSFHLA